jgi:peptidoglycan/LPS O-acetylase OafA/YrhL
MILSQNLDPAAGPQNNSNSIATATKRLVPLEAFRGLAAMVVLIHHFFFGFAPYTTGILKGMRDESSLIGSPFYFVFNGAAAVAFFFTLSGFVLCWSYFNDPDPRKLQLAFFKRYPRLVGLVVLTNILSYLLFKFDLYYFSPAAEVSKSGWLATFTNSGWTTEFKPSFVGAVSQGLTTFFTGKVSYNTNLWTMKEEFFGSLYVYMLACFIVVVLGSRYLLIAGLLFVTATMFYSHAMMPFVVGVFFCALCVQKKPQLSYFNALLVIFVSLYLLGFREPIKSFAWLGFLKGVAPHLVETLIQTIGSCGLILAVIGNQRVFNSLSGKLFALIGKLSFPLYLIHTLVICSVSSFVFLILAKQGYATNQVLVLTFAVTTVLSVVISVVLYKFDDWWVSQVNAGAKKFFSN